MKFRQLEYFVAAAEASKFAHAAGRLPVSQTAVQKAKSNAWVQADPMSFLESVSMDQKTQGGCSPNRCIVSLNLSCSKSARHNRSARLREIVCHCEGAGVDQCHACAATATQHQRRTDRWLKSPPCLRVRPIHGIEDSHSVRPEPFELVYQRRMLALQSFCSRSLMFVDECPWLNFLSLP